MKIAASFSIWGDGRLHFQEKEIKTNPPQITVREGDASVRIHSSLIGWFLSLIGKSVKICDAKSKESAYVNTNSLRKWANPLVKEEEKPLSLSTLKKVMIEWVKVHQPSITFEELSAQTGSPPIKTPSPTSKTASPQPDTQSPQSPLAQELRDALTPISKYVKEELSFSGQFPLIAVVAGGNTVEEGKAWLKDAFEKAKDEPPSIKFPFLIAIAEEEARTDLPAAQETLKYTLQELEKLDDDSKVEYYMRAARLDQAQASEILQKAFKEVAKLGDTPQKLTYLLDIARRQAFISDKENRKITLSTAEKVRKNLSEEGSDSLRSALRMAVASSGLFPDQVPTNLNNLVSINIGVLSQLDREQPSNEPERYALEEEKQRYSQSLREIAKVQARFDQKEAIKTFQGLIARQKGFPLEDWLNLAEIQAEVSREDFEWTTQSILEKCPLPQKAEALTALAILNKEKAEEYLRQVLNETQANKPQRLLKIAEIGLEIGNPPDFKFSREVLGKIPRELSHIAAIAKIESQIARAEFPQNHEKAKEPWKMALDFLLSKPIDGSSFDLALEIVEALALLDKKEAQVALARVLKNGKMAESAKNDIVCHKLNMVLKHLY